MKIDTVERNMSKFVDLNGGDGFWHEDCFFIKVYDSYRGFIPEDGTLVDFGIGDLVESDVNCRIICTKKR